jgi:hypothetical protein
LCSEEFIKRLCVEGRFITLHDGIYNVKFSVKHGNFLFIARTYSTTDLFALVGIDSTPALTIANTVLLRNGGFCNGCITKQM